MILRLTSPASARMSRVVLAGGVALALLVSAARAEERVLFDFEGRKLTKAWTASGKIGVSRVKGPTAPKVERAPRGHCAVIRAKGRGGMYSRPGALAARLVDASHVSLWIHRPNATPAAIIEVQFLEKNPRRRFWRKVTLDHAGWKRIALPLKWFRHGSRGIPSWSAVTRIGIYCRGAQTLAIDDIAVTPAKNGALRTAADLRAIAFPDGGAKVHTTRTLTILTDQHALDRPALAAHCAKVERTLDRLFPFLGDPTTRPTLIVFATEADYRAFPPRFAAAFGSDAAPPTADGFTLAGVATSFWSERWGTIRPVYTHEWVHASVTARAGIPNRSEWLQEGIASLVQLALHPQPDVPRIVRRGIADESKHLPLERLTNGKRIPTARYWQAMTLVELLFKSPPFAKRAKTLFDALRQAGSTDLGPHLAALDTDWPALTAAWTTHCATTYRE